MALLKGKENASWGFRNPSDGWHTVIFQDGVQLAINETSKKESLRIPMAVDEGGEDDGCRVTAFINTRDENRTPYKNVEQNIADVIMNAGMFDKFAEKYADADSYLDSRIIEALKLRLPGQFVMIETQTRKDQNGNERCNVIGWAPKGTKKEPKKAVAGKKEAAAATTKVDAGSDW